MSVAIGVRVPGTSVEIVLVLKSMLMDVSLYGLKMKPGAVPVGPPSGGGGGGASGGGGGGASGGGGVPASGVLPPQLTRPHSAGTRLGGQSACVVWAWMHW